MKLVSLLTTLCLGANAMTHLSFPMKGGNQHLVDPSTGDEFEVSLVSNMTTGFSWEITDSVGVDLVSHEYVADVQEEPVTGSGGQDVFRFRVTNQLADGDEVLKFVYQRPWLKTHEHEASVSVVKQ
ncbi:MAG: uncharacterized protein KVP18_003189 [Porospora cf. gigantea A]|uniref:uncharacterized protein n=1 Tax=Porospora cf. gigantea A TaxID=2853593 RepID=UPI003559C182|nr:MAG: hypothetical protein KVP18_003189 [Porospora cf. gigantea A]